MRARLGDKANWGKIWPIFLVFFISFSVFVSLFEIFIAQS